MDSIRLTLPARADYAMTLRLVVASLGSRLGFDLETLEDVKLSVQEAFNSFAPSKASIDIEFRLGKDFEIEVFSREKIHLDETEFALRRMILETLMDRVSLEEERILLVKEMGESNDF